MNGCVIIMARKRKRAQKYNGTDPVLAKGDLIKPEDFVGAQKTGHNPDPKMNEISGTLDSMEKTDDYQNNRRMRRESFQIVS